MDTQALADITDVEALRAIIAAQAQQLADAEAAIARQFGHTFPVGDTWAGPCC